eukprot:2495962-Pyramimonas_sp.AAC.1
MPYLAEATRSQSRPDREQAGDGARGRHHLRVRLPRAHREAPRAAAVLHAGRAAQHVRAGEAAAAGGRAHPRADA